MIDFTLTSSLPSSPLNAAGRPPVVAVSPLPNPLPEQADTFAVKVTITAPSHRGTLRQDVFGFASGQAVVALVETAWSGHFGNQLANEPRLLSLLYSRARAHKL